MKKAIIYAAVSVLAIPVIAQPQDDNWSEPFNMEPPICTELFEITASLNRAEDMIVFKTSRGNQSGLFTSHFIDGQWTEPEYVEPIGNPPNLRPCLSPDGSEIYFSCLCGGFGDADIWKVVYDTLEGTWSDPINLGSNVNDEVAQFAPFISYDGQNLYFINLSLRFEGIAVSYREGEGWSYPELASDHYEFRHADDVSLTFDKRTLFLSMYVRNIGPQTFVSVSDEFNNWSEPELFVPLNEYGRHAYPRVNSNQTRVYFSKAMEGGYGSHDIWFIERPTSMVEDIEEYVFDRMLVYPNPSNSYFNILIEGNDNSGSMVFIYDILGRELNRMEIPYTGFSFLWPENSGDTQSIASGFYFFKLIGKRGDLKGIEKAIILK